MATIDLGPPRPTPHDLLDGLPRRVALTLPELLFVAERAHDAPLPFDVRPVTPPTGGGLDDRLGRGRAGVEQTAYAEALDRLHDPATSLSRRGLMVGGPDDGAVDEGILGAVGLLATPEVAVDLDVAAGSVQLRSWHRQSGGAVAALSTQDGLVFELAWFPTWAWAAELARVAVVPEELPLHESSVPDLLDVPHGLADAAVEAARTHRSELVPVLLAQETDTVTGPGGRTLSDAEAAEALTALATEARGRLRALVAEVGPDVAAEGAGAEGAGAKGAGAQGAGAQGSGAQGSGAEGGGPVGVLAWTLVADGWRALRAHRAEGGLRLEVARVIPDHLAAELAPVLAEVAR